MLTCILSYSWFYGSDIFIVILAVYNSPSGPNFVTITVTATSTQCETPQWEKHEKGDAKISRLLSVGNFEFLLVQSSIVLGERRKSQSFHKIVCTRPNIQLFTSFSVSLKKVKIPYVEQPWPFRRATGMDGFASLTLLGAISKIH